RIIRIELSLDDLKRAGYGISLGRSADLVDQLIEYKEISRRHARISWDGARVCVEDLNSTNGTHINGRALTPFEPDPVAGGDEVKIGQVVLNVDIS
ncbi:MAG: FHA domain-containing protein, partial [Kangiella sp.]|nr:FHA domain-containing protein [Kangiella sp.]